MHVAGNGPRRYRSGTSQHRDHRRQHPGVKTTESRVVLAQRPTRREHLHGAWWPRTSDITHELEPMLALITERFGAVHGVMLNRDEWPGSELGAAHRKIGRTKISWYGLPEAHQAVLLCDHARRITLLLLPPDTPERIALTATLMACTPGNALSTDETLVRARAEAPTTRATGTVGTPTQP